jgi:CRISPR/Cas system CSM-associated protein Csm2 small subunit
VRAPLEQRITMLTEENERLAHFSQVHDDRVRREEREACAKVLESMIDHVEDDDYARGKNIGRDDCIAAIRAMNEKEGA